MPPLDFLNDGFRKNNTRKDYNFYTFQKHPKMVMYQEENPETILRFLANCSIWNQ